MKVDFSHAPPQFRLYVDVGTSVGAPHSADWLLGDPMAFVVGIEPSPVNCAILKAGRKDPIARNHLHVGDGNIVNGTTICGKINHRFTLLECAIDDVDQKQHKDFYLTDERNTGCSSLLKPTPKLELEVVDVIKVPTLPLASVLDTVPWSRCAGVVEMLKVDTQGRDLSVLRSAGDYLEDNVRVVKIEYTTFGSYEGEHTPEELDEFMGDLPFVLEASDDSDRVYRNLNLR